MSGTDGPATDPEAVARECLARMESDEERDTVGELFADDAVVRLPGETFEGPDAPESFLAFLEPRYEWVAKEFDRWYVDDTAAVSAGTLYGVDTDGESFEGVRYVDVYEVEDGEIVLLDVYNDLLVDGIV